MIDPTPDQKAQVSGGSSPDFSGGAIIPDHELLVRIGTGSYGEVWLARNVMGTYRAVKIVHRKRFESDRPYEREFNGIQKFEPVSRSHECQVDILHIGRNNELGYFYYVMELADDQFTGREIDPARYHPKTLRSEIQNRGKLPFDECLQLGLSLTTALEHLHGHGLIHRDIKPSNIIFVNGIPKLADIGLVTSADATLSYVGTEGFIPLEGPGSAQADIYSLGKVLYEISTGRDRRDFPELPTRLRDSPEEERLLEFNAITLKACENDLSRRYKSAAEMHADLVLLQSGKSITRMRWMERRMATLTRIGLAAALFASLSLAAYFYQRTRAGVAQRSLVKETVLRKRADDSAKEEAKQRARAEAALSDSELGRAENLFALNDAPGGIASLARILRQNPANRVAANRLVSALTYRSFALPIAAPIDYGSDVLSSDFSPDGEHIALGLATNGAVICRVEDGRSSARVLKHDGPVHSVRYNSSGNLLFTLSGEGSLRVWNVATATLLAEPFTRPRNTSLSRFSDDGQMIVTASSNKIGNFWNAQLWNVHSRKPVGKLIETGRGISAVAFSPDGKRLATGGWLGILIWDTLTGDRVQELTNVTSHAELLQFSRDGKRIAAGYHSIAGVWDLETGAFSGHLRHGMEMSSVSFSPDGDRLVTASEDGTARVWDCVTGRPFTDSLRHNGRVISAGFSEDGQRVITISSDSAVQIWDSHTGKPLIQPIRLGRIVAATKLSRDGQHLFTFTRDNTAQLWDVRPGGAVPIILPHVDGVVEANYSSSGRFIATSTFPSVRVWDAATGEALTEPLNHPDRMVWDGVFSPDESLVLSASRDSTARIWDWRNGRQRRDALQHDGVVRHGRFSPDGRRVLTVSDDGTARLWDSASTAPIGKPMRHAGIVVKAEFSHDGKLIATASIDKTARLWNGENGRPVHEPLKHGDAVMDVSFSPDEKLLATASRDRTVSLWDIKTGERFLGPLEHGAGVTGVEFSPDGQRLLTASVDARIWDVKTGRQVGRALKHSAAATAHFSLDGRRVVTASSDHTARIWDAETGFPVSESFDHDSLLWSGRFSPDGQQIATSSQGLSSGDATARNFQSGGVATIWSVPVAPLPVPHWFIELAEALGGQRLNSDGNSEEIEPAAVLKLREKVSDMKDNEFYANWARWFFADRLARAISPISGVSVSENLQHQTRGNRIEDLRRLLTYQPTNAVALARLAGELIKIATSQTNQGASEAELLIARSLHFAPDNGYAWQARAQIMLQCGNNPEALACARKAAQFLPPDIDAWAVQAELFESLKKLMSAYEAYAKVVQLTDAEPHTDRTIDRTTLAKLQLRKFNLRPSVGLGLEVDPDHIRRHGIPRRPSGTKPNLIDLTCHYNAGLRETWHSNPWRGFGDDLSELPEGVQNMAGTEFDIRGIIQLSFKNWPSGLKYPNHVSKLKITAKSQRLYFLQSATEAGRSGYGKSVAEYVIHYRDGRSTEMPVVLGEDVGDFWARENETDALKRAVIAWRGTNPANRLGRNTGIRLFKSTWENPYPDAEIESLDCISTSTAGNLFIVAITAE